MTTEVEIIGGPRCGDVAEIETNPTGMTPTLQEFFYNIGLHEIPARVTLSCHVYEYDRWAAIYRHVGPV